MKPFSAIRVETFYDFRFRAKHCLSGKSPASGEVHWHSYAVRFWFTDSPDQDVLSELVENELRSLHGSDISVFMGRESTDENIAELLLLKFFSKDCVRVRVTNDERRGAEASLES